MLIYPYQRAGPGPRAGAIVVLVAVVMVILVVAAAMSMDIAYTYLANEQLHVASDAAAKAAVTALAQGGSTSLATSAAVTCAAANTVCGGPLTLVGSSNVTLGSVTYSPSGNWVFTPSGTPTTAARVSARATVSTFFAPALGITSYSSTKNATAAFVRNKICLVIDRSASMSFDLSGVDWSYPPGTPPSPYDTVDGGNYGYDTPPHPTLSRWANLTSATASFLNILAATPVTDMVAMTSFSDSATTDCTFVATYAPITNVMATYAQKSDLRRHQHVQRPASGPEPLRGDRRRDAVEQVHHLVFRWSVERGPDPMTLVSAATTRESSSTAWAC